MLDAMVERGLVERWGLRVKDEGEHERLMLFCFVFLSV